MKAPLFEFPSYQYQIKDWEFKKKGLLKRLKEEKFIRTDLQTFETDRQTNKKSYLHYFQDLIKDELWEFVKEAQVTCSMTCLLYTSPSPRDLSTSRMPSSA